jgi:hypothetical protein
MWNTFKRSINTQSLRFPEVVVSLPPERSHGLRVDIIQAINLQE